ncbi:hypothetical protein [Hazenella coriacea]|uniref:Uncharacterized protein n=1 Tax=Hazenella coriacea TaxID=1179467 RepID=A0A4R3L7R0_9BACL|nr:hypothetical protein [Hazenella coriacea]TCS95659.1 hypothetical protein EDD58_102234 [Hazenella coriacea]
MVFYLKHGEMTLGRLEECERDFPYIYCLFMPTDDFEQFRPLFDEDFRLTNLDQYSADLDDQIRSLELYLISEDGEELGDFQGHIFQNEAWVRE